MKLISMVIKRFYSNGHGTILYFLQNIRNNAYVFTVNSLYRGIGSHFSKDHIFISNN